MGAPKGSNYRQKEPQPAKSTLHFRVTHARKRAYMRAAEPGPITEWATNILDHAAGYKPGPKPYKPNRD
jgi:hypothetical protein